MLRTTMAGLRARKLRLVATALAIVLGVGFVAGTLIFGDTVKAALYDQFALSARGVDAAAAPVSVPELPLSTVDTVRALPGVSGVDGRMQEYLPLLDKKGKLVGGSRYPGLALSAGTIPGLRPFDVATGRVPASAGEAALSVDTVARTHYALGDAIAVLDRQQVRHTLTLVGIVSFGSSKQYADQAVVIVTSRDMTSIAGSHGYQQVVASAAAGTTQAELATRIAAALGSTASVRTGAIYRDDLATKAINQFGPFLTVLLVFAVIACVVSAFVIYNTFTILMAQRIREVALLRCVGAARPQIFGSVLLESAVVGLVGAALGLVFGLLLGLGLFSGLTALGAPLPSHALVLTARPALVAVPLGVLVTVAAALLPALRATRIPPLAALRVAPLAALRGTRRRTLLVVFAILVGALGTALTLDGSRHHSDPNAAVLLVVAGGLVNFLAVLLLSPLFVGPLTGLVGWLPGRLFGVPARLAVAGARRNPGRVAATTAALMVGVGLMASASVALATIKATATGQLNLHYPVDYILQPADTGNGPAGIPPEVAQRLRGRPGLGAVAAVREVKGTLNGHGITLGTADPAGRSVLLGATLPLAAGSTAEFHAGTVILFTGAPAARGRHVGDTVTVSTSDGHSARLTVVALASGKSQTGDAFLWWDDFAALHPSTKDDVVMVRAADGVKPADSRAAVESVTDDYPLVEVGSIAEWRAQITGAVDTLIGVVAALLAIAILIALIGIMNTLSLSVVERTRESATIRAVGLTRGQLRAMLLTEALLMGVVGALVGVGFGLLYGWATTRVLFTGFAAIVTVPVGQLLGYVALAAVAAVLAAVLPARKAARASIVAAMAET
jgi:putative ABC transport system permease protein